MNDDIRKDIQYCVEKDIRPTIKGFEKYIDDLYVSG